MLYYNVCVCLSARLQNYHLAGGPGWKVRHHFIHLFELLGHGLDLSMQFFVLSILVIEHSLVLVPLLICVNAGILPVETAKETILLGALPAECV